MVFCCVVGCSNRSENSTGKSFFRIPSIITHHDEETQILTKERRTKWFNNIKREDINKNMNHYRVCSDHFINGKNILLARTGNIYLTIISYKS